MPKQPAPRQSAKYREQQLRRRLAAQERATLGEDLDVDQAPVTPSDGSTVTFAPASVSAATRSAATTTPAAPRVPTPRPPTAPRRAATVVPAGTVRPSRGRLAAQVQTMNLEDEMANVRSDVRRLLILAAVALVILIVLAFALHL